MEFLMRKFFIFILLMLTFDLVSCTVSSIGKDCNSPPNTCDDTFIRHIPMGEIWHFQLNGSWSMTLLTGAPGPQPSKSASFQGDLSIIRINTCQIKVDLRNVDLGHQGNQEKINGSVIVNVNSGTIGQICLNKGSPSNQQLIALSTNIVSALLSGRMTDKLVQTGRDTAFEEDQFGLCSTDYSIEKPSKSSFMIIRNRNLKKCSKIHYSQALENGQLTWRQAALDEMSETAKWECRQYFTDKELKLVKCVHDVRVAETSNYKSQLNIRFLKSEISKQKFKKEILVNHNIVPLSVPNKNGKFTQKSLEEKLKYFLGIICESTRNGIKSDALLAYPEASTILNLLSQKSIVSVFEGAQEGSLCADNEYFMSIFSHMLSDTTSPAACSAKCTIMIRNGLSDMTNYASSLAYTIFPTKGTLSACSPLLDKKYWMDTVLGISTLAGNFRAYKCPSKNRDYDGCNIGLEFDSIVKSLLKKAKNCRNPDEKFQKVAVWAINGLANLGSVGSDVTDTLVSCISTPVASDDVVVSSLMALGRKRCTMKTTEWLQSLLFNETLGTEVRIEVTKTLHNCNYRAFRELINLVNRGDVHLKSTQVISYLSQFSTTNTTSSWFHLSRHFDLDLSGVFGLSNNSVLEGDIIFEDSFIPKSLSFNFASDMLKYLGGSAQFKVRQRNLEDVLQPLIGPGGSASSLYSIANEAILLAIKSLLKLPENVAGRREKRSINIDDAKDIISKIKVKVRESLHGMFTAGFGGQFKHLSTFSLAPFFDGWEAAFQKFISRFDRKILSTLADYKFKSALAYSLRNIDGISWSFLGNRLYLRQHEGFIGTLQGSSSINILSLLKSPFSPSVDLALNPNIAGYWHSSFSFKYDENDSTTAKVVTPISGGFDVNLQLKPKVEENYEITFDLPQDSFQGYSATISKELITSEDKETDSLGKVLKTDPFMNKYFQKGLWSKLLLNFPMKVEMEYKDCHNGLISDLGLKPCWESISWKGVKSSLVYSKFEVEKEDKNFENFQLSVSSKNPGSNSYFLSGLLGSVGGDIKKEVTVVFGLTFSPHSTLKVLMQSPKHIASFEVALVNDLNLKRLEARSKYGIDEYGLKAELLMVQDGGQVSVKPRLVISRPSDKEDSLLEGYLAHYSSEKLRSMTVDLVTDGSLKKVCDVAFKGTSEYRMKANGEWGLSFRNLHLVSPGIDLGIEAVLNIKDRKIESTCQVTLDGEVFIFGSNLQNSDVTDSQGKYEFDLHFLRPDRPHWDTKLGIAISVYDGEVQSNVTLQNGPVNDQWQFEITHSTSWMFIYSNSQYSNRVNDFWSRFLDPGRTIEIKNKIHISTPSSGWDWKLNHDFQISHYSLENQVSLITDGETYKIMANLYDQSDDKFKYHMEIEVKFPLWKFSYVDTLLQRGEGDIVGQSVTTMPSGRLYTSSVRLKHENSLDYLLLEFSYDTLVKDGRESFRVSAKQSLEFTANQLNFHLSAEALKPILSFELMVEGLQMSPIDLFIKAFWIDIFEVEASSRSTGAQTDIGFTLELIPYDKNIKSKVLVGRGLSGGGTLDGEVIMSFTKEPTKTPLNFLLSTSLDMEKQGIYVIKNDVSLMGWGWSAELGTDLGRHSNDPQKFNFTLLLPDMRSFNGDSVFLFNFENEEQTLIANTRMKLPSGIIYQLSIDGGSRFSKGSLAIANLEVLVDTPFTEKMSLKTYVSHSLSEDKRDFTFYCDTHSEANYWKMTQTNLTWGTTKESFQVAFAGMFGEKSVNLKSNGSYKFLNETRKVQVATEIKLPYGETTEQLKAIFDGDLYISSFPPIIKLSQKSFLERNYAEIFRSDGNLHIKIPEANGKFVLLHSGTQFTHQEYTAEGAFTGRELEISIQGMIDNIPVRITSHYIDGISLHVFASYGGSSYASIEFTSELEGFAMALREDSETPKLTTNGVIIWRKRQTSFNHVLRITPSHSSSSLKIDSIRGRPVKFHTSRSKLSPDQWKTESNLEWGSIKLTYSDEVIFKNWKDFKVIARFNCPAYKIRDIEFNVAASHVYAGDQKIFIKFSKEANVIHSGRFSIETSSIGLDKPWEIYAELSDIVVDQMEYSDLRFKQLLGLPKEGIQLDTSFQRGGTPLAEISLNASKGERDFFFSLCSSERKCIRLKGVAQSFSEASVDRYFAVEFRILNSLFWKKSDEDIVQHSFGLIAENKYLNGEKFHLVGKLDRSVCEDIYCETSASLVGKHHVYLIIVPQSMDVMYETKNRTMLIKTSVEDNPLIIKLSNPNYSFDSVDQSKFLRIKFWFDSLLKPDEIIMWNTAYIRVKKEMKTEEFLESVITHPFMDRPLTITGKLGTDDGNLNSKVNVDFDVFHEAENAVQLFVSNEINSGVENFSLNLKQTKEEKPHLSITGKIIPSPDFGIFDLKIETPLHPNEDVPFNFKAEVDINRRETMFKCYVSSKSISESLIFGYGQPKETSCSGMQIYGDIYDRYYRVYALSCRKWPSFKSGVSLTDNPTDDMAVKFGFKDAKSLEANILDVIQGSLILRPPYLLQGSFSGDESLEDKLYEFKEIAHEQWKYFVLKTKITMAKAIKDGTTLLEGLQEVVHSSQINDFSKIVRINTENVLEELQNDELFQDVSHGFLASVNASSILLNAVVLYVEAITGSNFETLSYYTDLIYESVDKFGRQVALASQQELQMLIDRGRDSLSYLVKWIEEKWMFVLEESIISEPLKWIQHKFMSVVSLDIWSFMTSSCNTVKIYSEKVLSLIYGGFASSLADKYNAIIPLPISTHVLKDVPSIIWTTPQNLQVIALKDELSRWAELVLHPEKLLTHIFYPSNAQSVILHDSLITFDGQIHHLSSSCPHLLFATGVNNDTASVAIATESQNDQTLGYEKDRQFLLLVGNDSIKILPSREVIINNVSVHLPFKKNSLSLSRDLNRLDLTISDYENRHYLSLICQVNQDSCLLNVDGWLQSDTFGLLGTLDYNRYNDHVEPNGMISPDSETWEDSWSLESNCSSEYDVFNIGDTIVDHRFKDLCTKVLLSFNSPVLACHDTVNIIPYYEICLKSLQFRHNPSRTTRDSTLLKSIKFESDEHELLDGQRKLSRKIRSVRPKENYFIQRDYDIENYKSLNQSLLEAHEAEIEVLCDVVTSYVDVCLLNKISLKNLPICDLVNLHSDSIKPSPILIDFILMVEEASCSSFIDKNLISTMSKDMRNIFQTTNIDTKIGIIGYGLREKNQLTFYGSGHSLLMTLKDLKYLTPSWELVHEQAADEGSLQDAIQAILQYPFRDGSVRVAFVASCSNQDISQFASSLPLAFQNSRILVYSLTTENLVDNPDRPKTTRNTIGIDANYIYHMRRGKVSSSKTWGIIEPTSNIAQLSLQTGGGVFTTMQVQKEKKLTSYMKLFKDVFYEAILIKIKEIHSNKI